MIPFDEHCTSIEDHIERDYGIRVVTRDIRDPLTGDLDGAEIHVDFALSPEMRLFLVAHLFGHTVQWNVNPRAFEIGRIHEPPVDEALLPDIMEYELEAAGYGLGLLHQIGITDLDQWLSDFTACDIAYLLHFYRTGNKVDSLTFWRDNTPCLPPRAIPSFTPSKRVFSRNYGIVI